MSFYSIEAVLECVGLAVSMWFFGVGLAIIQKTISKITKSQDN